MADVSDCEKDEKKAGEYVEEKILGFSMQQDAFTLPRSILEIHGNISEEAINALFMCQRAINVEKARHMHQSTIEDHFVKKESHFSAVSIPA